MLLAKSQMAVGKYAEAMSTVTAGLRRYSSSYQLRMEAYYVLTANAGPTARRPCWTRLKRIVLAEHGRRGSRLRNQNMVTRTT